MPSEQTTEHVVEGFETTDTTIIKIHVQEMVKNLRNCAKTRELAVAITKLQEGIMWIDEHQRVN